MTVQQNFSLLGLLSFLRSLDTCAREKAHFLGGNFTANELSSVEQKLHIHRISLEPMRIVPLMLLPEPELIRASLKEMASFACKGRPAEVKTLIRRIEDTNSRVPFFLNRKSSAERFLIGNGSTFLDGMRRILGFMPGLR